MNVIDSLKVRYFSTLSDKLYFLCGLFMLFSEIVKQLLLTFVVGNGQYNFWYFPFQLCSIPMYILLAYPWCQKKEVRMTLLAFLMSYTLLGGMAVFADTSGLYYTLSVLTFHSFAWHILLILIGISAGFVYTDLAAGHQKRTPVIRIYGYTFSLRPFIKSTCFYLVCCAAAELINLSLDRYGLINMFYINPDYSMNQVVFRNFVPLIGNIPSIILYILMTSVGAFLLFFIRNLICRRK